MDGLEVGGHSAVAGRLDRLRESLRSQFGDGVQVTEERVTDRIVVSRVTPSGEDACPFDWLEAPDHELILEVGEGGRWELPWDEESVDLIEQIVDAVVAGHVEEQINGRTARLRVSLGNGQVRRSSVTNFALRTPHFWQRSPKEDRRYAAYR